MRGECRPGRDRSGFTLLELLVVIMMLGILAGIAIPNFQKALWKATAAHVIGDARTVHLAASEFLTDNGRFPSGSGWGRVPPELEEYLPDGYDFEHEEITYLWASATFPNDNNAWGTRHLGIFAVNYASRPQLSEAMRSHQGRNALWSGTLFLFLYPG